MKAKIHVTLKQGILERSRCHRGSGGSGDNVSVVQQRGAGS